MTNRRFVKIPPLTFPLSVFPMKVIINSSMFYLSKFRECSIRQISSHLSIVKVLRYAVVNLDHTAADGYQIQS